jgi:hypothetical protein
MGAGVTSRGLGRASAKRGAGFDVAAGKGASRERRYRARFINRELTGEEIRNKIRLGLGLGLET